MGINSDVSIKTLLLGSFLTPLALFGAAADEQSRLQDEIADARNAFDALVLRPGMKLDDPRVREKAALVDEKVKAFQKSYLDSQNGPPSPKVYPNKTPDRPNGEREEKGSDDSMPAAAPVGTIAPSLASAPETSSGPATVLSGEGIKSEISYSKKPKPGKSERPMPKLSKKEHSQEAVPSGTAAPDASGLSEIQYPKK